MNKSQIAVGLDAGSAQTRCVICLLEDSSLQLVGYGQVPSQGWSKGRVADQTALADCIRSAVKAAEREAGFPVDAVVLGLGGTGVSGVNCRGRCEFRHPRAIEREDLRYASELAADIRLENDRVLLQVCPQDFTLDGRAGYRNPKGATCRRLEANVHVLTASAQEHQCLVAAVHQAHLAVEETIFEAIAAAYAAILPDDRNRGIALVDVGVDSTDLTVYDGSALVLASSLPVAAGHLTRDIAWVLKVSYEDAERLKREYGCALLGLTADNILVEVPSAEGRQSREVARRELNAILEARAEEIFIYVRDELVRVGMEQSLFEGVVLTGGGTQLNGMCDIAEQVLNCQARNGLAVGIEGWPRELDNPGWTVAAGLAMYSARLKMKREIQRKTPGLMGLVLR